METDGANNRRHIESEQAVEAMDTQESDVINDTPEIDNLSNNGDANMQVAPAADSTTTVSMDATSTDPLTEEQSRAEATFSFKVEEFSKLKESVLSPPYYVRNLPWKIMVMPRSDRSQQDNRSLGFFLQCNGESDSQTWSCHASAELRLKSFKEGQEAFTRRIKHLFYSKENDWGFSFFMSWNEILDPEKGYVKDDCIILEVHVQAEAPHGVYWDSKKHTGCVGLKNQGATCYMNSLLQTLYFTNQLRKAVYKMPTEADDSSKSVALALQRVFYDLQFTDKPVGTKKLTKSFGWETLDSFMQHDVQEFLRVLLDKLESKMKGTCVEGTVPKLFEGKMQSYIKCKNVEYKSTRLETFYDIQLNIKGKGTIYESFEDYIAPETLEGDNKYDAGEHGFQEAEKGVKFVSFPPVLHLHLMRFQYDPITDNSVKFNDRFEFYEEINLDRYLDEKEATPADYILHAVLVHSGDNHGGHYVVYINPTGDRAKWCKFDDDVVSRITKSEAIEQNYGGNDDEMSLNAKHCSNAYMLVYIRVSALKDVLQEITRDDIPGELKDRLEEEKRMDTMRRRDRSEMNSCITIQVLLEEYFEGHQTTDLFDTDKVHFRTFRMKRAQPVSHLIKALAETFKVVDTKRMRIWPLPDRLLRPKYFDFNKSMNEQINNVKELQSSTTIFLELAPADIDEPFPPFDRNTDVLIFFKFYDPQEKRLNYAGYKQYSLQKKVNELIPDLNKRLGFPIETDLTIYEENAQSVFKINSITDTLEKSLKGSPRDDVHGSILIFEKKHHDEKLELPTCNDYIQDLTHRVEITFIDKCNPNDTGFTLELSQRSSYEQFANAVGQKIKSHPYQIQFFKCQNYKDMPGNPIRGSFDGQLKEVLTCSKKPKKLFYQRLSMNINELENKKQFKCLWLSSNLRDEKELVLYPNKNGTVKNLLEEASKQIEFTENSTQKLRIVEISCYKLSPGPSEDTPLESLQSVNDNTAMSNQACQKVYRIEEVPRDELIFNENEMLIPVSHFTKEIHHTFGVPFYIKVKQGETFGSLKERIQKKLNVPDKEWEKYKTAIISMGRADYVTDDLATVNLGNFKPNNPQAGIPSLPYLGLEHINKSQKRSRYTYLEKAIKIYN